MPDWEAGEGRGNANPPTGAAVGDSLPVFPIRLVFCKMPTPTVGRDDPIQLRCITPVRRAIHSAAGGKGRKGRA